MHKKFETNRSKIKAGCQSGKKVVTHNSKSDLPLAILLEHMHTKFEINRTKIKGGCQSERKVATHNSKSAPLVGAYFCKKSIVQLSSPVFFD